ncbi:MAG: DUF3604 domain-containing protein [Tateyamaria sp.]|uniref:DUF3604 domain-containing protein n=1 Tax=Tateyamaria sp. TaxID=1929288 RepID=UPI00329D9A7F
MRTYAAPTISTSTGSGRQCWLNADGATAEKVFDAICADDRANVDHACNRDVGNTANVANATSAFTIGNLMLAAVWTEPEFDPS